MKDKGLRKKESSISLDIGTRLIKALELSQENAATKLTKLHSVAIDLPLNAENTAKALNDLFEALNPSVKEVKISLSAPSAIVRFISMPTMKGEDLKNALRFEAEKYIPFNINEVFIDAVILEQGAEEKNQMKVLLAAAKKDTVNSRIALLKELGFTVGLIDIDSFACFNAFCNVSANLDESKSTAILNIGYTHTNVIISRGRYPFFTRDIQIGGRDIIRAISKELQTEEVESEKIIMDPHPQGKAAIVEEAAKSVLNSLIDELRLSFGYYENQFGSGITEIFMSGGVTEIKGISVCLEENLGIKPLVWNPLAKFEIGADVDRKVLERSSAEFGVCAGLAIRKT